VASPLLFVCQHATLPMAVTACRLRQLGPQRLGGINHHLKGGFCLFPAAGLEAAIRVDPEPLGRDLFGGFAQQPLNPALARHVRRVDVVDARANLVGVVEALERFEQLHLAAAGCGWSRW
jgi:hypothetical protein